jgi:hypothetical protein
MDVVGAALFIAILSGILLFTLRGAGAGAQLLGGMFQSPAELGWPAGVQEDDDLRWRWTATAPGDVSDAGATLAEIIELSEGSGPTPIRVARRRAEHAQPV